MNLFCYCFISFQKSFMKRSHSFLNIFTRISKMSPNEYFAVIFHFQLPIHVNFQINFIQFYMHCFERWKIISRKYTNECRRIQKKKQQT